MSGDSSQLPNYPPISLLHSISKMNMLFLTASKFFINASGLYCVEQFLVLDRNCQL